MKKAFVALVTAVALFVPAGTTFGDAPPCSPGDSGCKTVDDPSKNNPKFTETQRGNVDAAGTENTCVGANPGQTKQVPVETPCDEGGDDWIETRKYLLIASQIFGPRCWRG